MSFFKAIISFFYAVGVFVRNRLYDIGILRTEHHCVPIVCVGNITVGGTGKTPTVEFLAEKFLTNHHPVVLSRGYGRRTKGYMEVTGGEAAANTGDEPLQIKMKFPAMPVIVCEDRNYGVKRILKEYPQTDIIIMDDGFQHRSITAKVNVVLIDFTRPVEKDHFLPYGTLRDERYQLRRADIFLVTKAPYGLSKMQKEDIRNVLCSREEQHVYFTSMVYGQLRPLFPECAESVDGGEWNAVLFSGIANPDFFAKGVAGQCRIVEEIRFPDHHVYKVGDMKRIEKALDEIKGKSIAVTTEKDAVKLLGSKKISDKLRSKIYVLPMKLAFGDGDEDKFIKEIFYVIASD